MYDEMKSGNCALLVVLCAACTGCVTTKPSEPAPQIIVDQNSTRLEGWLSAKGEWMLFPIEEFDNYDPYVENENEKCVSLVNGTRAARSDFAGLDDKKVLVTGFAVPYYDLELGTTVADRLLSKRYWKDEVVLNSCLRQIVFVATKIELM